MFFVLNKIFLTYPVNASLSNNYICIGQKLITLATGNGTKTVSQLLDEAFTTLSAYSPSSDEATHFIVESANIPMGDASVLKSCLCFDRNLYATFNFSLIDFGINAVRANNISLYGVRMQTSGSMFSRTNFTSSATAYTNFDSYVVNTNIKVEALLTLYKKL